MEPTKPGSKKKARRRSKSKERDEKRFRFSKVVVTALLVFVALFTVAMVVTFFRMGCVPDSLITAFYAFAGGEAGFLGLIKYGETKFSPDDPEDKGDTEAVG